jgi:hypothetical protein
LPLLAALFFFSSFIAEAKEKPFRRVFVVDSGSSYDTAVIVGVLNGLEKEMTKDDLIIATNASSLAAAIFLNFPLKEPRLEYLQSEKYFKFLGDWTIDAQANGNFIKDALAIKMRNIDKPNPALPALVGQDGIQHLPDPFEFPKLKTLDWQFSPTRWH